MLFNYWNFLSVTNNTFISHLVYSIESFFWFTSHALHSLQSCLSCRIIFDSQVMLFILYSHAYLAESYLIHKSCSSFSIVILVIVCIHMTFYLLLVLLSHQLTALCSYCLTIDDSKNPVPDNNDSKNAVTDTQFIAVSPLRKMFMNISHVAQFSKVLHPFDASEAFAKIHAILMQLVKKVFIWIYNKFVNSLFHCYYSWSHFRYFL